MIFGDFKATEQGTYGKLNQGENSFSSKVYEVTIIQVLDSINEKDSEPLIFVFTGKDFNVETVLGGINGIKVKATTFERDGTKQVLLAVSQVGFRSNKKVKTLFEHRKSVKRIDENESLLIKRVKQIVKNEKETN